MELFIEVYVWLQSVFVFLSIIGLAIGEYPRETSRGMDAIRLIIAIPFLFWALYLII